MFVFSPSPVPGCLPQSNTKLKLFINPIVFVLYLFTHYMVNYLSFFHSLTFLIWMVSFVFLSPAPVRNLNSQSILLQSSIKDYTSPIPPATYINPTGWHHANETYHCPHSSLSKPHTRVPSFLFGFLTLDDGTHRLS
jgi:hypothetical protein